jgi:hypothetical protein
MDQLFPIIYMFCLDHNGSNVSCKMVSKWVKHIVFGSKRVKLIVSMLKSLTHLTKPDVSGRGSSGPTQTRPPSKPSNPSHAKPSASEGVRSICFHHFPTPYPSPWKLYRVKCPTQPSSLNSLHTAPSTTFIICLSQNPWTPLKGD